MFVQNNIIHFHEERVLMNLLETILEKMSSVNKAQRKFIVVVLTSLMCLRCISKLS